MMVGGWVGVTISWQMYFEELTSKPALSFALLRIVVASKYQGDAFARSSRPCTTTEIIRTSTVKHSPSDRPPCYSVLRIL
jgi:hypothetical protein